MSRHIELFAGGMNGFAIKDIEGYYKWKESLVELELANLLHEDKRGKELYVYVGIRWEKEDFDELDTTFNHFNPSDGGEEYVIEFWAGLSLFTKEPIELFQTDEEFPYLTKVWGHNKDDCMYRLFAKEGKVTVQTLGFTVISTEKYNAKDVIDEDIYKEITSKEKKYCDKCKTELNLAKFNFANRGYYTEINTKHKYTLLCEKCYTELKKPFSEIRKLQSEIDLKQKEIDKLKEADR